MPRVNETRELLVRWSEGSQDALAQLVEQERDFVTAQVRRRLGSLLRRHHDTQDVIQQTMLQALRSAPRFIVSDRGQLRGLLARMVENTLRAAARFQGRQQRDVRREQSLVAPVGGDSVLDLDPQANATDPGAAAARGDTQAWVRLALELLEADDRAVIVWRDYEDLPFAAIGDRMGLTEDAARMRHKRALPRLAAALTRLRRGQLGELL